MTSDRDIEDVIEDCVFRFESAWQQAARPAIRSFLPADEPLRSKVVSELLLVDVDRRLTNGETVLLSDYDSLVSEFAQRELLENEIQQLIADRQVPDVDSTLERTTWSNPTRYRLVELHAKGGLGQVSIAMDKELKRKVAIKEIQPRFLGDAASRERFIREAEITGGLEHPGIVPVYDIGVFPDGSPYYVMPFIQGVSLKAAIVEWHDRRRRSQTSAAELSLDFRKLLMHFVTACDAVQYAHDHHVLHRDLKPSNIMLGPYGETFVVDWGLAKTRDLEEGTSSDSVHDSDDDLDQTALTAGGEKLGTPNYMSPEQAAGNVAEITPSSDLYSLGATLYHLLAGVAPFASISKSSPLKSPTDSETSTQRIRRIERVVQAVQAGEFRAPSLVVESVSPSLEAICLKAMSLKPGDRYRSVAELAADMRRWLADEAISVWPGDWWERLGRWSRRNRSKLALMAGLVSATLVMLAIAVVLLNEERRATNAEKNKAVNAAKEAQSSSQLARHEAERAQAAQKQSELEAARANELARKADLETQRAAQKAKEVSAVSDFLVGLFQSADPISLRGGGFFAPGESETHLTAREVVLRGVKRIDELADQPLVQATLCENLGDVLRDLGDYDASKELLFRSLKLRESHLPAEAPEIGNSALSLGRWHLDMGVYAEVKSYLDRALQIRVKQHGADSLQVAEVEFYLAWMQNDLGQLPECEKILRHVWRVRQKLLGPTHLDTNSARVFLGMCLMDQRKNVEATVLLGSGLNLTEIPKAMIDMQTADRLRREYKFVEARMLVEPLIKRADEVLGKQHPLRALMMSELAGIANQQGHWKEAKQFTEEAFSVLMPLRRNHPLMSHPLNEYASGLERLGYFDTAMRHHQQALRLAIVSQNLGIDKVGAHVQRMSFSIGYLALHLGDYAESERMVALEQNRVVTSDNQHVPSVGMAGVHRFYLLAHGRIEEAAKCFEPHLEAARKANDFVTLYTHGSALREVGRYDDADKVEAPVIALLDSLGMREKSFRGSEHFLPADIAFRQNRLAQAEHEYRLAVIAEQVSRPADHPEVADMRLRLARFLRRIGKLDEALSFAEHAERDVAANIGDDSLPTTAARLEVALIQAAKRNFSAAIRLTRSALSDRQKLFGNTHPAIPEAQLQLAEILLEANPDSAGESLPLALDALEKDRQRYGSLHSRSLAAATRTVAIYLRLGQDKDAASLLNRTLQETAQLPPTCTESAVLRNVEGHLALQRGDLVAAEKLLTSSTDTLLRNVGLTDERTQRALQRRILLETKLGHADRVKVLQLQLLPPSPQPLP